MHQISLTYQTFNDSLTFGNLHITRLTIIFQIPKLRWLYLFCVKYYISLVFTYIFYFMVIYVPPRNKLD